MEMIKIAAIKRKDGTVFTGRNHAQIIQTRTFDNVSELKGGEQGFITEANRFVGRTEAAEIALKAEQISKPTTQLFSEDITGEWPWAKDQIKQLQAELDKAEAENKKLKKPCRKVVRLNNQTGKGLPCVTSKYVQCSDIFEVIRDIEQIILEK